MPFVKFLSTTATRVSFCLPKIVHNSLSSKRWEIFIPFDAQSSARFLMKLFSFLPAKMSLVSLFLILLSTAILPTETAFAFLASRSIFATFSLLSLTMSLTKLCIFPYHRNNIPCLREYFSHQGG